MGSGIDQDHDLCPLAPPAAMKILFPVMSLRLYERMLIMQPPSGSQIEVAISLNRLT